MLPAQKTFALSFCLRDRPIRPYTFGTRFLRASPECGTPGAPGGTSCDFVLPLCTAVHSRKTLSYFRLLGKPFTAFYAPVSSFIPEGEFYFGMTFSCLYRSMGGTSSGLPSASSHSSAGAAGGAPAHRPGRHRAGARGLSGLPRPQSRGQGRPGWRRRHGGRFRSSPAPRRHWRGRGTSSPASSAAQKGLQPFAFIPLPPCKKLHKAWPGGGSFMQKRRETL